MLFKKKQAVIPQVCIRTNNAVLYEGPLKDIPIKEDIIIEKSIFYFDDPEPCYIHRNAVKVRLSEELYRELQQPDGSNAPGPLLLAWADFDGITECILSE